MPSPASLQLVTTAPEVIENIQRFQEELQRSTALHALLGSFQAWYAYEDDDGQWLYGPAKFIVGAGLTAQNYRELGNLVEIRAAEKLLSRWFGNPPAVAEDSHFGMLAENLARYGRVLSENARVMVYNKEKVVRSAAEPTPTGREQVEALLVLYRTLDAASQHEFRRRLP